MPKLNKAGSALLWAVLVCALLTILTTGALTVAKAYHGRSMYNYSGQQAYYTARSAVQTMADAIVGGNTALAPESGSVTIDDMGFADSMGACSVTLTRNGDNLLITATADSGGRTATVSGELKLTTTTTSIVGNSDICLSAGSITTNRTMTVHGNVYTSDWNLISLEWFNWGEMVVDGDLYSRRPLVLSRGKVTGNVYALWASYNMLSLGVLPQSITAEYIWVDFPDTVEQRIVDDIGELLPNVATPTINHVFDADPVLGTTDSLSVGAGNSPSYYYVDGSDNTVSFKNITVEGTAPVYIGVASGVAVDIKSVTYAEEDSDSELIFVLQGNAKLTVNGQGDTVRVNVVGGERSTVYLQGNTTLKGLVYAGSFDSNGNNTLETVESSAIMITSQINESSWSFTRYVEGE